MRASLRLAPFVLAALLAAVPAVAEPVGSHFELTPFAGYTLFDGKLRYPGGAPLTDDLHVGGRLGWYAQRWVGLEAAAGLSPTTEDLGTSPRDFDFMHASGNFVVTPAQGRWGGPFAFVGGGYEQLKPASGEKRETGGIEFGGGLKFWLTDAIGLRLEARDLSFKPFETTGPQQNLHNVILGAGLTLALGATPRDTDGDGVPDRKDKCPGTPAGAKVDATGCPIDSDGDGVYDGLDQCPETPKGATVDAKGCPSDADGDGVFDGLDQCANTPQGAKVDEKGCPIDADGDGVTDDKDQCPDTPAGVRVDATGCPIEVTERETELLDTGMIRLQGVNFETAKADLLPESYPVLDVAGAVLKKWPQLQVEIGGHTDSRGSKAKNTALSEARATAVRDYLVQKYPDLKASQLTVKGYGPTKPIAPNNNALNMAKNRRVEFVVLNKDVLRNEIERRRTLMKGDAPADSTQH